MTIYYVDTNSIGGVASDDNEGTSLTQPWKTLGKANSVLMSGETVYIREGTYNNQQIKPSKSGTKGNYITYINYNDESVVLSGYPVAVYLYGNNYVKIDGIRMQNGKRSFVLLAGASHNIIQNCAIYDFTGYWGAGFVNEFVNPDTGEWSWRDPDIGLSNDYNQILNNIFEDAPDQCPDIGDAQDCETAPSDHFGIRIGKYNQIEGNTFGVTSHLGLTLDYYHTQYNIIRNNTFQNEYRMGLAIGQRVAWSLVEGNEFYNHGHRQQDNPNKYSRDRDSRDQPAIQYFKDCRHGILRYNIFDNNGTAIAINEEWNYFYSNTLNKQLRGIVFQGGDWADHGDLKNNKFKNNIVANTQSLGRSNEAYEPYNWYSFVQAGYTVADNEITHNAFTGTTDRWRWDKMYLGTFNEWEAKTTEIHDNIWGVDPLFINEESRNFNLKSISSMINAGAFLTTITSSTANNQTSFTVNDTGYFYDGWNIPGETGDTIKTQNGQITVIQSINYNTNTITVSPAINIIKDEGVALNYEGTAPDIGAYEYGDDLCNDFCDGTTRYYSGIYNPTTGECVYEIEPNSEICGYIPPEDPEETPITAYFIIGGVGLALLAMMSKK